MRRAIERVASVGRRTTGLRFAFALAVAYALLNAGKPLHIDDTATWLYARQVADHPLDPYGFRVLWAERPEPASEILLPPLVPYWLSPALRLVSDEPLVWKLWLIPVCLALGAGLFSLLTRFASGWERPLLAFILFSPGLLPSLNLMLDVPALALSLLALLTFLWAADRVDGVAGAWTNRRSAAGLGALAAGVLLGLAAQTKYTGLLGVPAVAAWALLFRRPVLGALATAGAATVFVGWETFTAVQYGDSHFLLHLASRTTSLSDRLALLPALAGTFGGVAPGLGLLALLALGASDRALIAAASSVAAAFAAVALCPERFAVWRHSGDLSGESLALAFVVFLTLGFLVVVSMAAVAWRLLKGSADPVDVFLVLWLLLEAAGSVLLSPFSATRRVLGLLVVGTILAGRLAARAPGGPVRMRAVLAFNMALGALFFYVDLKDAQAARDAVHAAATWIRAETPVAQTPTVWYVGHWGFQYYAERAGMKAAYHGGVEGGPHLLAGDWLVVPFQRIAQQSIRMSPAATRPMHSVEMRDALPLRTVMPFYLGRVAIDRLEGPRFMATIYRVTRDFEP